jgi:hypothetical protein
MNKNVAFWLMIGGIAVSAYDLLTDGSLYGSGKPLESLRWKVYTTQSGKNWYVSVSDLAAITGAFFYFRKK